MKDAIFDTLKEFENAFPLNQKKYQNYALQFIHESNDAKDLVNDSFAKLWEKRSEISDSNIEAYFYTIIKNNCLDYLRRKAGCRAGIARSSLPEIHRWHFATPQG